MRITITIFFSLILVTVFSQKTIVIEGQITNVLNEVIPYASISLEKSLVATTSNAEGQYTLAFLLIIYQTV